MEVIFRLSFDLGLLLMPCCQVCGERLSFRALLVGRFTRQTRTYPFPMAVGGHRKEFPTHWQCEACVDRAEKIRANEPVMPAGPSNRRLGETAGGPSPSVAQKLPERSIHV